MAFAGFENRKKNSEQEDHINTTTTTGRFTFNIFTSLAKIEREIIRERTKTGLNAAKARVQRDD